MSFDKEKFASITAKPFSQQAVWWLNGVWDEEKDGQAENIYKLVQTFKFIDNGGRVIVEYKGKAKEKNEEYKEGNELDEFKAHKFLETLGETLTALELRKKLENIDVDKNHKLAFIEYLIFKFKKTPEQVIKFAQGDNKQEIDNAQAQVEEAQAAVQAVQQKLADQKEALALAASEEADAKKKVSGFCGS